LRDNSVAKIADLTGEPVGSKIRFRVKLVAYFCVHNVGARSEKPSEILLL